MTIRLVAVGCACAIAVAGLAVPAGALEPRSQLLREVFAERALAECQRRTVQAMVDLRPQPAERQAPWDHILARVAREAQFSHRCLEELDRVRAAENQLRDALLPRLEYRPTVRVDH